jgi:small subunit ribosomal protein S9
MAETKIDNPAVKVVEKKAANVTEKKAAKRTKPLPEPAKKGPDKGGYYWGTGRRKSAVARVRIKPGKGKLLINKRELGDYFPREQDRKAVMAPLKTVEGEKRFDVFVNVQGGGSTGQAGAVLLGIARALKIYDESYLHALRDSGHLTRDSRMVERKKPGQRGARRRFQFSKR